MIILKRKNSSKLIMTILLLIAALSLTVITGCSKTDTPSEGENSNPQTDQEKIMADFQTITEDDANLSEVIAYIDENISKVSKENGTDMILNLEKIQQKNLPALEEKYYDGTNMQEKIYKEYEFEFDFSKIDFTKIDELEDSDVGDLLKETNDLGYRVETAEGTYFPMINYGFYKKYSSYVTEDISSYIDIMEIESTSVPAKDAALIISWQEIINRALSQERFLEKYADSVKATDIKQLEKKYMTFILYGLNNTPLFDYESKQIEPEAEAEYFAAMASSINSKVLKTLGEYMEVVKNSGGILTQEVENFRDEKIKSFE